MVHIRNIDGVLIQWGERLFYSGNRVVHTQPQPRLHDHGQRAAWIRERIEAAVVRRAPQVMVKITGGGRGMKAIAAHFRYISKSGRLEVENELGERVRGWEGVHELAEDWRLGGSRIDDESPRREAVNVMLSMPRGTDSLAVQRAAREFAKVELVDHKYVMVLHDHQANPHVHISVRTESRQGRRLNPRKSDLQRWRETFAEKLRDWGVEAEATRQPTRGTNRSYEELWRTKAREDGRLRSVRGRSRGGQRAASSRSAATEAWIHIYRALLASTDDGDRRLAASIHKFINGADRGSRTVLRPAFAHGGTMPAKPREGLTR